MEKPAVAQTNEAVYGSIVKEARIEWALFFCELEKEKLRMSIMGIFEVRGLA